MINVNETTKNAYISATHKNVTITFPSANVTFTNSDLVEESLELTETIETERNLTFKGCIASQFRFKVADIVQDLRGQYLEAFIQADNTQTIPLFKGYVDTQDNMTHEDIITEFTCYDPLYKIGSRNMQSWVDSRTYPITVKNFRNQLFSALGITQEAKTLVNDGWSIQEEIKGFVDEPSAVDLMRWICQLNGVFGQYGRDGKFHYREIKSLTKGTYPSPTTYPSTTTYPSGENADIVIESGANLGLTYEPYEIDLITKVTIYDSGGLDIAYAGSGNNVFGITDNPIAFSLNNMTAAAQAIFAKVGGINYIPVVSMKSVGMPYMECGDTFLSYTKRYVVRTPILSRTLNGIQALFDEYTSDSDRSRPEHISTTTTRINKDRQSIIEVQADIVEMNEVIATKATIAQLNATNARVGNLEADHVTTQQLQAVQGDIQTLSTNKLDASTASITYATISSLNATNLTVSGKLDASTASITYATIATVNAVNGKIDSLTSKAITTENLSSQTINGSQITAGTIKAEKIEAGTITATQIQNGTIDSSKVNLSASDSEGWGVSISNNGTSFSKGSYGCGGLTGSFGSNRSGWGIDFTNNSLTVGSVTADMVTADYITSSEFNSKLITSLQTFSSSVACTVLHASSYVQSDGTVYCSSISLGVPGQATSFSGTCQVKDINGITRTVLRT